MKPRAKSKPAHGTLRKPAILRDLTWISTRSGSAVILGPIRPSSQGQLREAEPLPPEPLTSSFFPCTSDDIQYWGVYFSPIEVVSEVDRIFSSLYFERVHLAELHSTPEHVVEALREKREKRLSESGPLTHSLRRSGKECKEARRVYSYLNQQSIFFSIRHYAARYNDNFILTGWTCRAGKKISVRSLTSLRASITRSIKQKNELEHSRRCSSKTTRPCVPSNFCRHVRPASVRRAGSNPFVAITYVLLFGIMFGDVGQGLCVSLVGALMWRYKHMALGKALVPCGFSSAFFGLVYGSVFGYEHVLDPMYRALFGLSEKPVEVMEADTTILIILAAVGIGIFLVLTAILINIICSLRRKRYESALRAKRRGGLRILRRCRRGLRRAGRLWMADCVPALYHSADRAAAACHHVCRRAPADLWNTGLTGSRKAGAAMSWRISFELFEVLLGYASNTISFLRVGAFVLVHAGMMTMVFTLAEMSGGIGYVLIVILGNIIVMGMEGLLVGIQVMRLEFYEMFSRFFEGGGRPFRPIVVGQKR